MSVTNLTGTTWLMNDTVSISSGLSININFKDNELNEYVKFEILAGALLNYFDTPSSRIFAYSSSNGWYYEKFKTIEFIGGEGVTNTDLITWLEANATQILPIRPDFYKVTDLELTSIADAIRSKASISGSLTFPNDFISEIEDMGGYCNISIGDYCDRTYTSVEAGVSAIGPGAFYRHSSLTTISFPNCISIGNSAFYYCSNLTTISFPNCTSIGSSAFYYCFSLTTASFPNCTTIGDYAFRNCSSLTIASFPSCTTIGPYAFYYCSLLTTISFPNCTSIRSSAFYQCYSLTTASFPKCTIIGVSAFTYCSSLTTLSFPECSMIGGSAFRSCYKLTTVSFPKCSNINTYAFENCISLTTVMFSECLYIGSSAFQNCHSLVTISFPKGFYVYPKAFSYCALTNILFPSCRSIFGNAFDTCSSLTTASFPLCIQIASYAFTKCYNLLSLYLNEVSQVTNLSNSNAFTSTPIAGYTNLTGGVYGSIYVPSSLLTSFKTATNWTYFSDRIVGV